MHKDISSDILLSNQLSKTILSTVIYFDVLEYPLTAFELWKYSLCAPYGPVSGQILQKIPLVRIMREADDLVEKGIFSKCEGRYTLFGRSTLVFERGEKIKHSMLKLKRARHVVYWLRMLPFVRMIGITGRLSLKNIGKTSDWDVLVVLEKKHIWIGRTFLTVFLHSIRKRRWGSYTKDRFCLNYFITNEKLEIGVQDLFAAKEYAFLLPLFGQKTFALFEMKNAWIKKFLPRWSATREYSSLLLPENRWIDIIQKVLEVIFDSRWLEDILGKIQKKKIQNNPKTHHLESYIVTDETALIFLPNPHGPKVFEKFYHKLQQFHIC